MNPVTKNKLLTWLVVLLLVANAATIAMYWLGKPKPPLPPNGGPKNYLIKELSLDAKQQEQFGELVKEHRQSVEQLRREVRSAKDNLFDLVSKPNEADSTKQHAAAAVSDITEEIDLLTLDHFQKVRALCTPDQQRKFDDIIREVTRMMGRPGPPMGPHDGPPPGE